MKKIYSALLILHCQVCFVHFSFSQGTWTQKASFPGLGRELPVSFVIGNKGYVGCGVYISNTNLDDFWEYDPPTNVWTQKGSLPGAGRYTGVGFSLNGKGYFGTGISGVYLKDVWEYDPVLNKWTQKANLPGPARADATAFSLCGKGYI